MIQLRCRWRSLALILAMGLATAGETAAQTPQRIVLLIADGVGVGYWTALAFAADDLAVNQFKVMGLVDTRASSSKITDSAAAATAFASGIRTYNGAIGVGPDSVEVETVLEAAQERGMATGLVATCRITHATPAAFAAHVPSRAMEAVIAEQILEHEVDVVLGGGRAYFDGAIRRDQRDLLTPIWMKYTYIETATQLRGLDTGNVHKLFGLFALHDLPAAAQRQPTLPEMTRTALEVLDRDPDGFFLMVEGSQPDWRGHENAPLEAVVAEMRDFDLAIGEALEYQRHHPETLVLVLADHETGGLAIHLQRDSVALVQAAAELGEVEELLRNRGATIDTSTSELADSTRHLIVRLARQLRRSARSRADSLSLVGRYTSGGHTAEMTPLFAKGPGAERFGGIIDNYSVGQLLLEMVRQ
ncbi:MAG: alkaline phosphatase [Gemmatimonadota bacterium]|nr:MAG: alkaline phosphatase [Gemmatimonadota bacterium]